MPSGIGWRRQESRLSSWIPTRGPETSWRNRWDSLKLFTPNRFNSLPGFPITGEDWGFPTKDEVADYLESYAEHFEFPIRRGVTITALTKDSGRFRAKAGLLEIEANNVVVAMANFQKPTRPAFADELDTGITQVHSGTYESPDQLSDGTTLVVGHGNSGAEIAMDLVETHRVLISGEPSGVQPFRPEGLSGRILMPFVGMILTRVVTKSTPMGRKFQSKMLHRGGPLLRVRPKDLVKAGVERVGRVNGVIDGYPVLEDGRVVDVANVVWCTGFDPGFSWIDLPVFDDNGDVIHERGVIDSQPGLYFVGLKFLYSVLSDTLKAIDTDASYVVNHLVAREATAAKESVA